jgi:hypothetical protein
VDFSFGPAERLAAAIAIWHISEAVRLSVRVRCWRNGRCQMLITSAYRMTMLGQAYRISKCSRANWQILERDDECLTSAPFEITSDDGSTAAA